MIVVFVGVLVLVGVSVQFFFRCPLSCNALSLRSPVLPLLSPSDSGRGFFNFKLKT